MRINYAIDERLDPIIATEAAAKHLKLNHAALHSWPLAVTAYNHGRNGMRRAKKKHGSDLGVIVQKYRSRTFGFASRNFYAEFLAALQVTNDHTRYFGNIQFSRPREHVTFETPHYVTVAVLLEKTGLSLEEFAEYNPALRKPVLNSQRRIPKHTKIRLPFRQDLDMVEVYAQITSGQKFDQQLASGWHKVQYGENLSQIAGRYGVSMQELLAINNIRDAHRIYAGQNLQLPVSTPKAPVIVSEKPTRQAEEPTRLADATILTTAREPSVLDVPASAITLKSGHQEGPAQSIGPERPKLMLTDSAIQPVPTKTTFRTAGSYRSVQNTLDSVAVQRIHSQTETIEEVMAMALPGFFVQMTPDLQSRVVRASQVETAMPSVRDIHFPQNGQVDVEPDETLGHLADWLGVAAARLRAINGFDQSSIIQVGQPVWLTFERVTPEEFHRRRVEYHQSIEEDFYRNFTIQGQKIHKVRGGENIWILCKRTYDMPFWLVKKHNPQRDLLRLAIGAELAIPLVEAKFVQTTLSSE
jgi:membrane-bound lytic murein transglycosylase D